MSFFLCLPIPEVYEPRSGESTNHAPCEYGHKYQCLAEVRAFTHAMNPNLEEKMLSLATGGISLLSAGNGKETGSSLVTELNKKGPPAERGSISRFIHSIRNILLVEGNLPNTFRTAFSVLKNDGWSGFQQRVRVSLRKSSRTDYSEWVKRYDTLDDAARDRIRKNIAKLPDQPLISILMPTYNTPATWLRQAIESVRNQLYENWELCIADDASTDPETRDVLEKSVAEDHRIKVVFRKENGHISAASNSALSLCNGEWVALMDHDDLLAEQALYCVADVITRYPKSRLIYSDEDKISEGGHRFDPYFKCEFNRELFYSHNMISHLGVYRRAIMQEIGGFREKFEGSQDYDLALRYLEKIEPEAIIHIPRVLYHWRRHGSSTASGMASKPYAQEAGQRALEEHLIRMEIPAEVTAEEHGYRVKYSPPSPLPLVSLILIARDDPSGLARFMEKIIRKTDYPNLEFLVVARISAVQPSMTIRSSNTGALRPEFFHYDFQAEKLAAINAAVNRCNGEYIALLECGTEIVHSGWLSELVGVAAQPGVGATSAKVLDSKGKVEHAGYVLGLRGSIASAFRQHPGNSPCYFGRAKLISGFSATSASCMVMQKSRFQNIGGYEDRDLDSISADVDLCLRFREAGYRNVLNPNALLIRSIVPTGENANNEWIHSVKGTPFIIERWGANLMDDPCYSPNLTLDHEDFSFAWPPRVKTL